MAGITGAIQSASGRDPGRLAAMYQRLVHQDRCVVEEWHDAHAAFAHVAASSALAGQQPYVCEASGRCIVFFGECLGFEEEARQLAGRGVPLSQPFNDAEFCLRIHDTYGEAGFARLNGSFCFALYDPRTRECLLVSDKLGSRPLFYGLDDQQALHFGTQVSCVLQAPGVSRALEASAVLEFCANQRVFGDKTYHKGVKALPPASCLRFREGRVEVAPYWTLRYRPEQGSIDEFADQLATTVRRAIGRIAARSGRIGILLSGGLDARMLVAAVDTNAVCYTFGDYENFETSVARRVAEAKGLTFRFLRRPADQYADMVDPSVEIGSGMHPFNHAHTLGLLDGIRQECDVLTHGYGTEIMFRSSSVPRRARSILGLDLGPELDPSLTADSLEARLLDRSNTLMHKGIDGLLVPEARDRLRATLADTARQLAASSASCASDVYDRFLWPDVHWRGRFPSFVFESSIRCFMPEASIDFDNEMIDLHTRIPAAVRADRRLWIRAMARLHKGIAHLVSANTGYSPFTPPALISASERLRSVARLPARRESLFRRAEAASGIPTQDLSPISWPRFDVMVRKNERLRERIVTTLQDPEALPSTIFDHANVKALLDSHLSGRTHNRHVLFALMTFGVWHKRYGAHGA
jgi:asparagine synthase (glutamine-hydrolysing)